MARAKDIRVAPIEASDARRCIRRLHYSGRVVSNSQLHLGVFLNAKLEGALQFGPPMVKKHIIGLVKNTPWNGMVELNRMAFSEALPRNSESRALGIAMRLLRKRYKQLSWVLSFADGTQCGDGTIYRASGFVLTQIKKNTEISQLPDGKIVSQITYGKGKHILERRGRAGPPRGTKVLDGFQFRYIYFLDPTARDRLTVPIIPFSKIAEAGASMYLGKRSLREKQAMARPRVQRRGSADLHAPI